MTSLNLVHKQIIWDRLISVVEEQAQTIIHTAFGSAAREAGDVSAALFDLEGQMLAQAITGTPGHVNSVANAISHFLVEFPVSQMQEGDVYITNDPWKATGHLFDITIVTPIFQHGKIVCLTASNTHVIDIGGLGMGPDATQIYHEGLFIPILKIMDKGQPVTAVIRFIEANVRQPQQVLGDIYALISCNAVAGEQTLALCHEYHLTELSAIGTYIIQTSRQSMQAEINKLPNGSWQSEMVIDGYDNPIELKACLTIQSGEIEVDFTGTSPSIKRALNVPLSYTEAYTSFGIRCIIGPTIPNNSGSLSVIKIKAPKGCILNAQYPSAVTARATIGMMMPDLMYGCLQQLLPTSIPAQSADSLWNICLIGGQVAQDDHRPESAINLGRPFVQTTFTTGGMGARPYQDGLSVTSFPSGIQNTSIEVTETMAPLLFWRKELRQDSAGEGQFRGGLGQIIEIESAEGHDLLIAAAFDRVKFAPKGSFNGLDGQVGEVSLSCGKQLQGKGRQLIPAGTRLIVKTPGGAGYGDPRKRNRQKIADDLRAGYISAAQAKSVYQIEE